MCVTVNTDTELFCELPQPIQHEDPLGLLGTSTYLPIFMFVSGEAFLTNIFMH